MTSRETAEIIQKWLSDQKYQGEDILHASVCCDFVGMTRFIKSLERIIENGEVYCYSCSMKKMINKIFMPIYHKYPVCKD